MRYDLLLFDLDHTLLDFDADEAMAFEKLYHARRWDEARPYSPELLTLYDGVNRKWWKKFEDKECAKQELFENRFAEFMEALGVSGDPAQVNEQYFAFLGTGGVPYPGALELLEKLYGKADIYIITNGNAETARTRTANSGVDRFSKGCFVSEAIGYAKPDKGYFDYVAAHIPNFAPERAVVIGDSLLSDMQGAVNAGLDSIWYHPAGRDWKADRERPAFTYLARSFEEIFEILQ